MVPIPTSLSTPTPATAVNSSGAEDPAAMKVAPATSSLKSSFSEIASREGTKKSSQMIAIAASWGKKYTLTKLMLADVHLEQLVCYNIQWKVIFLPDKDRQKC